MNAHLPPHSKEKGFTPEDDQGEGSDMSINFRNFCHVEETEEGIKVLFYVEPDGDDIILHQIAYPSIGLADLKITGSAELMERLWAEKLNFIEAAASVVSSLREMGVGFAPSSLPEREQA